MIDIKKLRENPEYFKKGAERKGYRVDIDAVLELDEKRRALIQEIDGLRRGAKEIASVGKMVDAEAREKGSQLKEKIRIKEKELEVVSNNFNEKIFEIPNPPSDDVPDGKNDIDNKELRQVGDKPKFKFELQDHFEISQRLGIVDFEAGAKVSGSQFYFLKNEGALLELALVNYALEVLRGCGFNILFTPDVAREKFYLGTGYLPKGDEAQTYQIADSDLGLIATAEVTLAGYHSDEILNEQNLPLKYAGLSHCFRKEAGAYGKYSKGLYRVHQFTKVEMFCYTAPEDSPKIHQELLKIEEKIFQGLEIPYRVLEICAGDLGAQAVKKYDLEAWLPGRGGSTGSPQGDWGEVTSTSNTTDYQARNLNIKLRRKNGEVDFAHTLNGTAVATSRVMAAILENFQRADGKVALPKALHKYLPFKIIPG